MEMIPNDQMGTDKEPLHAFALQQLSGECIRALNQINMNLEYSRRCLSEKSTDLSVEELRQALLDTSVASNRLDRTMDDLFRLLARLQDEPEVWLEPVELCEVLQGLCADREAVQQSIGVRVELDCGGAEKVLVAADRAWLEWICLQLLSNALRACSKGGCVEVSLRPGTEMHLLCVADDGCGLPEYAPKGENRAHFVGGMGVGLRLCREYCRLMGWTLKLLPRPEGGTKAVVRIPARDPEIPVEPRARFYSGAWAQLQREQQLRHAVRRELHSVPGLETVDFERPK